MSCRSSLFIRESELIDFFLFLPSLDEDGDAFWGGKKGNQLAREGDGWHWPGIRWITHTSCSPGMRAKNLKQVC